jgi:hypothetical protein
MLSVRIRGQNYRISNETLDRVFGESWRRSNVEQLQKRIQNRHDEGKLVVQGQRLRLATPAEEAEQRLRSAEGQDEILRWGLLSLASQIAEAATEVRAGREALAFDESAATAKLSRDTSDDRSDLESRLRGYRAEASDEFVERVAKRVDSARRREQQRA